MRNYKPSAHRIKHPVVHQHVPCYQFSHPRYDALVYTTTLAELNELLIELGHCPVAERGAYGAREFLDITTEEYRS